MADKDGNPIAGEPSRMRPTKQMLDGMTAEERRAILSAGATPATRPAEGEGVEACAACGQAHGSIGVWIECLSQALVAARRRDGMRLLAAFRAHLEGLLQVELARLRALDPEGMKESGTRSAGAVAAYERVLGLLPTTGGKGG